MNKTRAYILSLLGLSLCLPSLAIANIDLGKNEIIDINSINDGLHQYQTPNGAQVIPISNCEDLQAIGSSPQTLAGHYQLTQDIDMSRCSEFVPIGTYNTQATQPGAPLVCPAGFTGTLDGRGNHIRNLEIISSSSDGYGLFACLGGATVINITFDNVTIDGRAFVGTVAGAAAKNVGTNNRSLIRGVHVNGEVTINSITPELGYVGGITGYASESDVRQSSVSSLRTNNPNRQSHIDARVSKTGGLIGKGQYAEITENYVDNLHVFSLEGAGGLVGELVALDEERTPILQPNRNIGSKLEDSYVNNVTVTACGNAGGLIGIAGGNPGGTFGRDNTDVRWSYTNADVRAHDSVFDCLPVGGTIDQASIGGVLGRAHNTYLQIGEDNGHADDSDVFWNTDRSQLGNENNLECRTATGQACALGITNDRMMGDRLFSDASFNTGVGGQWILVEGLGLDEFIYPILTNNIPVNNLPPLS